MRKIIYYIYINHFIYSKNFLGSVEGQEPLKWQQWNLEDAGRAELPLKANSDERTPAGMAVVLSSTRRLPMDENKTTAFAMPILFLISADGILCGFYAVNKVPKAMDITKPPSQLMLENVKQGHINVPVVQAKMPSKSPSPPKATPAPPAAFAQSFVASTPIKGPQDISKFSMGNTIIQTPPQEVTKGNYFLINFIIMCFQSRPENLKKSRRKTREVK